MNDRTTGIWLRKSPQAAKPETSSDVVGNDDGDFDFKRPLWKEVNGNAQQAAKWTAVMEELTGSKSLNL